MRILHAISASLIFCSMIINGCGPAPKQPDTLLEILRSGTIRVITRNNAHCYYIYRDQPMGFEYDLAKAFADQLGVKLEVVVAETWSKMIDDLLAKKGHFIAASLTKTEQRSRRVAFSDGYFDVKQVIIVHKGTRGIRLPFDLSGKIVDIRNGTSYQERLLELRQSGIDVRIRSHEDTPTEELIKQVAEKKIKITVADENIALLNRRYYPAAVIAGPLSETQQISWAVAPTSRLLLDRINSFIKRVKKNGKFDDIKNRYYAAVDRFDFLDIKAFHRRIKKRLPKFLPHIQEAAEKYGFDWRLIAAQMYQESHFNPYATSHAGAFGLMQLTSRTAESLGVSNIFDVKENIHAGVKHLRELYDRFEGASQQNRIMLALAAYNIGWGHVSDARQIAEQMGMDPDRWDSISNTLPLLSKQRYYKKARYGYCRGTEPVIYVKQIMTYYDILKQKSLRYESRH